MSIQKLAASTNITDYISPRTEGVDSSSTSLVNCGNSGQDPCTIDNLIELANRFGEYILKIIFPSVFFLGLFFTIYPILKDPNNPTNIAEAKRRGWKLLIGTSIMLGAYLIIKAILISIGADDNGNVFKKTVGLFYNNIFSHAYAAESFKNPLQSVSIQSILSGIFNLLAYFAIIGIIAGIVRGVILLMLGQENPDYVKRGKKWIIYTLLVALIVFGAEMIYNVISDTVGSVFS